MLIVAFVAVLVGLYLMRRFACRALRFGQPLVGAAGTRPFVPGTDGWPRCRRRRCGGPPAPRDGHLVRRA